MEGELLAGRVAVVVFYFEPVGRKRGELCVDHVPVAGGIGFFCPQELVANLRHPAVAECVEPFVKNLFVVAPYRNAADRHRVVLGFAAIVGNLHGHAQVEFVLDRSFDATLVDCFGGSDGEVVALPYGDAENLRGNRVRDNNACKHRVDDAVVVQAHF